jgi:hypothetical protein
MSSTKRYAWREIETNSEAGIIFMLNLFFVVIYAGLANTAFNKRLAKIEDSRYFIPCVLCL